MISVRTAADHACVQEFAPRVLPSLACVSIPISLVRFSLSLSLLRASRRALVRVRATIGVIARARPILPMAIAIPTTAMRMGVRRGGSTLVVRARGGGRSGTMVVSSLLVRGSSASLRLFDRAAFVLPRLLGGSLSLEFSLGQLLLVGLLRHQLRGVLVAATLLASVRQMSELVLARRDLTLESSGRGSGRRGGGRGGRSSSRSSRPWRNGNRKGCDCRLWWRVWTSGRAGAP